MRFSILIAAFLIAAAAPLAAQSTGKDSAAVVAVVDAFHAAMTAGNASGLMQLIAPDAVFLEAGGVAMVWLATPGSAIQERVIAETMRAARAAEYRGVTDQARYAASGGDAERTRALRRLRGELRRIARRDFFPPAEREVARVAVDALAADAAAAGAPVVVKEGP